ncbi:hypothetical protein SmJEL517_g04567 [Synchytrium microbalum]|uniref:IQ motif and ubiquitin-like domain-containing protein n=1 Tax=Synchytrium microbalum TaxID=1806994 RepID=A0A507BXV7_9FUNG|nr:uncharacterized protein SmJEL517_g04567 [Synchytrium microbalum]TPX32262.1 hypothetical protein SmJEL517_g04567 [Synchytrium microbalum]
MDDSEAAQTIESPTDRIEETPADSPANEEVEQAVHEVADSEPVQQTDSAVEAASDIVDGAVSGEDTQDLVASDDAVNEGDQQKQLQPSNQTEEERGEEIPAVIIESESGLPVMDSHGVVELPPAELKPMETQTDIAESPKEHTKPVPNITGWYRKQYHGGFRDTRTRVEYYHADAQTVTPQELRNQNAPVKAHRDTQTKFIKTRETQVMVECATQMTHRGVYVTVESDKIVEARPYVTADEHRDMIVQCVTKIQCFIRKCNAVRTVNRMKELREEEAQAKIAKEERRRKLEERKKQQDVESRLHPRTHKDFEKLLSGLEKWRLQEAERIANAGYSDKERIKALADLLDQEASLLQKIDRLKFVAAEGNYDRNVAKKLDAMAAPKVWSTRATHARQVLVETPTTVRASELRDLHRALCTSAATTSVDERLQVLLHVKYTVKEFDCALTRDIVDLIDREGDMVSRGRDAESLEGLRKRTSNMFLQFIQTPEFNPEAARFQKIDGNTKSTSADKSSSATQASIYQCRSCSRYLPSSDFRLSATLRSLNQCRTCANAADIATRKAADPAYAQLLAVLRTRERASNPDASKGVMDLLQEVDLRYLIDTIWTGKSAVSGVANVAQLMLVRWDKSQVLSPWNCILLTKSEAAGHEGLDAAPEEVYAEAFVERVRQRHVVGRRHFGQVVEMMNLI